MYAIKWMSVKVSEINVSSSFVFCCHKGHKEQSHGHLFSTVVRVTRSILIVNGVSYNNQLQ
jgi:hypothetical protein